MLDQIVRLSVGINVNASQTTCLSLVNRPAPYRFWQPGTVGTPLLYSRVLRRVCTPRTDVSVGRPPGYNLAGRSSARVTVANRWGRIL